MKTLDKMSKKEKKEYYKKNRILIPFNTGIRVMKTEKFPSRTKLKKDLKKCLTIIKSNDIMFID